MLKSECAVYFCDMRNSLLILLYAFTFQCFGQVEVNYEVKAEVFNSSFSIVGIEEITLTNKGDKPIAVIPIEIWGNAYQPTLSFLAKEFLEDQKLNLLYADDEELGSTSIENIEIKSLTNTSNEENNSFQITKDKAEELYLLTLNESIKKNESISISFSFIQKLPSAKFNGFGYTDNSIRLSKWFPRISGFTDSSFYPVYNSRGRFAHQNTGKIDVELKIEKEIQILSSYDYSTKTNDEKILYRFNLTNASDLILYLTPQVFSFEIPKNNSQSSEIKLHYHSDFPTLNFVDAFEKINNFLTDELNISLPDHLHILCLENKDAFESSGELIVIENKNSTDDLESDIVEEFIKTHLTEKLLINGAKHPWMVNGLAHYYKMLYLRTYYPNKKYLGWFAQSLMGKFFDADEYNYEYRNIFLYHYMVRQGLDQPISDSAAAFPTLNYEAVIKGKTSLYIDFLRNYCGDKEYKRGMQKFLNDNIDKNAGPQEFIAAFNFYSNKDLNWFLDDIYNTSKKYDYKIKSSEKCSYVQVAKIKNIGSVSAPYSLTGIKNEKPVLTEWFEGHEGVKTVQMHLEDYDEILINYNHRFPEFNQRNNSIKTKGIFKHTKPLRLQFYTSLENPDKTQIFWLPSLKYNAYDLFSVGATIYNSTLVQRPFEFRINPEFSTGTGQLVGSGSLKYNWTFTEKIVRQISAALYGRRYHYGEDLAYNRISPSLNFYFRKSTPRSEVLRTLKLRSVLMDKDLPPDFDGNENDLSFASYQVINAQYIRENVNILKPSRIIFSIEASEQFSKVYVEYLQRFRLDKNHLLGLRFFAGTFIHNEKPDNLNFYGYGLSGTTDYLFDYYFIGRSDETGVWSNQMFLTDGGFKSETNQFTNYSLVSLNAQIPIWRYLQVFGDVAYMSNSQNNFAWDYGVSLVIVPDFLEIHFPFQNNQTNFLQQDNYIEYVRYVLNLDPANIINRLRRGYY